MNCPDCGTPRVSQFVEGGVAVRLACRCEAAHTCDGTKKCRAPAAQVELDPDGAVARYLCTNHGYAELDAPSEVAPPVATPPVDADTRVGLVVEEHGWLGLKRLAEEDLKNHKYKVVCMDCANVHLYARRKLVKSDNGGGVYVCPNPKCTPASTRYQVVED